MANIFYLVLLGIGFMAGAVFQMYLNRRHEVADLKRQQEIDRNAIKKLNKTERAANDDIADGSVFDRLREHNELRDD